MKQLFLASLLFAGLAAAAQDSTQTQKKDTLKNKPQFKLSANYNSGLHYYGRTDSLRSSGFFPMAEFWITPKFYVNAAPIFVNNALQSFDYVGTVATIGYQKVTDKWITGAYVLKPFYEGDAQLVQSALKAQTGVNVSKLHKIVNVNAGVDARFTDGVDFGATAGIDHIVRLPLKSGGVVVLDPGFSVNAGTQRYSRTYTKKNNNGGLPLIPLPGNGNGPTTETREENQFKILSYEASVPLIYAKKKWMLIATPAYVLPQNLLPGERGNNLFYVTTTVKYTF
ncbi:hypothetical protein [Flaviaesturariibacter amylovorans]|uniref:MipA/OmpV family protein n=1 Tax=Flaviaesturariibacter amylovorans TaxID=1084520 RepID=A0ABP8HR52_9BACT